MEGLERREVQTMESRPYGLPWPIAQSGKTGLRCASCFRWIRSEGPRDRHQLTGLREGGGIAKPIQNSGRILMQAKLRALPRNLHDIAARSSGCPVVGAAEIERLAALKRSDPVYAPPSKHGIGYGPLVQPGLILAEWELIPAAEVEYLPDIEIGRTPIEHWARARYVGRTERGRVGPSQAATIQQVGGIRQRLGPSVSEKVSQPARELLLELGLQAVVGAHSNR